MRRWVVVGVVVLFATTTTTAATAAVAPVFSRTHARVGDEVSAYQPVTIGRSRPGSRPGIIVYLIRLSQAVDFGIPQDGPPPPALARFRLGELVTDRNGVWHVAFRVPRVRPGAYTTLVWCKPCGGASFPHGSVFPGGFLDVKGVLHVGS